LTKINLIHVALRKIIIAGHEIQPGEFKEIDINIARLPSHTVIDTPIYVSRGLEDGTYSGYARG